MNKKILTIAASLLALIGATAHSTERSTYIDVAVAVDPACRFGDMGNEIDFGAMAVGDVGVVDKTLHIECTYNTLYDLAPVNNTVEALDGGVTISMYEDSSLAIQVTQDAPLMGETTDRTYNSHHVTFKASGTVDTGDWRGLVLATSGSFQVVYPIEIKF